MLYLAFLGPFQKYHSKRGKFFDNIGPNAKMLIRLDMQSVWYGGPPATNKETTKRRKRRKYPLW